MARRRKTGIEPHVRFHAHEMKIEAWKTLCTDARALLIEFRSLWNYENRIFLSIRQMMKRLNIGQRRAEKARDQLLNCGWIKIMENGSFSLKVKHATVYALTNEPLNPGKIATKDYMKWRPENTR